ncbi:hypothetical protein HCX48_13020 [Rhodocyclus tenuis]|uniref:Uncharacterized protein n=1 Tax=Rhodocyclus gracilis TaxID=2929842 RepID=A0ABX0WNK4_9RHOO|nr:hypothetical protein [Rhodocyclus gracilis]NJA90135.1 hypothetical protein [Rhodocyclus gracilis]
MNEKKLPSFGRPGRPRRINFSDLFLWDPAIELELSGVSISEIMGLMNPEMLALYQDIGRKRPISIERAKAVLPSALESVSYPLADEYRKALNGEESHVTGLGSWRSYIYSRSIGPDGSWPPKVSCLGQHFIEIEQALKEPTLAWQQDHMSKCADLIASSPVLAPYLWPEVVVALRNARTVGDKTYARCMVLLELFLSYLAYSDAKLQTDQYASHSMFEALFPDFSTETIKPPNASLFDWLEAYTGTKGKLATCIQQISKCAADTDIDSVRRQLRRWRRGTGFPSLDVLDALFRNLYGDKAMETGNSRNKDWVLSWGMVVATKRINFLLPIVVPMNKYRGPFFPFGCETVQEWRESRYRHWYQHWLPLIAGQS